MSAFSSASNSVDSRPSRSAAYDLQKRNVVIALYEPTPVQRLGGFSTRVSSRGLRTRWRCEEPAPFPWPKQKRDKFPTRHRATIEVNSHKGPRRGL